MTIKLQPGIVADIPLTQMERDPKQPRQSFDQASLKSLGASLKIRQEVPLLLRQNGKGLIIVDGERRWRAAKLAGLKSLKCLLDQRGSTPADELALAATQLTTSVQREDLKPLDIGEFLLELRTKRKRTTNELMADLAKAGINDIGPGKIDSYIELTKLPDWAKNYLRDGTFHVGHGQALLSAIAFPEVLKRVKQAVGNSIQWKGNISTKEITEDVRHGFDDVGTDLNPKDYFADEDKRHFAIEQCRKCEFYKKFGKDELCMNRAEFDKKNKAALVLVAAAAAKKAAGKPEPKMTTSQKKAESQRLERRSASRFDKFKIYFDTWLRPHMRRQFAGELRKKDPNMTYGVTLWLAAGAPETLGYGGRIDQRHQEAAQATQAWIGTRNLLTLPDLVEFSAKKLEQKDWDELVNRAVECMTRDQVRYIAHLVDFDLVKTGPVYLIDEEYLRMKRKSEMVALAGKCKGIESVKDLKGGELRALLLKPENAAAIGVPADIQEIYGLPFVEKIDKREKWEPEADELPDEETIAEAINKAPDKPAKKRKAA